MVHLGSLAWVFSVSIATATVTAKAVDLPISYVGWYVVNVTVGSPGQSYLLEFDSGSSTTWIVSDTCGANACPEFGRTRHRYNISASSSGKFTGRYATNSYTGGEIAGQIAQDVFEIGGLQWSQTFVDATLAHLATAADGLFGIAFPSIADDGTQSLLDAMGKAHVLAEPKFGLYYGDVNSNEIAQGGVLTIGGTREDEYVQGSPVEVPIVKTEYNGRTLYMVWRADLSSLGGAAKTIQTPGKQVVFDTGAGDIEVANTTIHELYESLGLGWNWTLIQHNQQILPCSDFNSSWAVSFDFGETGSSKLTLTGDQLAKPGFPAGPGACYPPFSDAGGDYNIFGAPFFSALYTTWDFGGYDDATFNPSIRFGQLKEKKKAEGV